MLLDKKSIKAPVFKAVQVATLVCPFPNPFATQTPSAKNVWTKIAVQSLQRIKPVILALALVLSALQTASVKRKTKANAKITNAFLVQVIETVTNSQDNLSATTINIVAAVLGMVIVARVLRFARQDFVFNAAQILNAQDLETLFASQEAVLKNPKRNASILKVRSTLCLMKRLSV